RRLRGGLAKAVRLGQPVVSFIRSAAAAGQACGHGRGREGAQTAPLVDIRQGGPGCPAAPATADAAPTTGGAQTCPARAAGQLLPPARDRRATCAGPVTIGIPLAKSAAACLPLPTRARPPPSRWHRSARSRP